MINIPIFIPSDNNYVAYMATCIAGILYNTKNFCEIYILDSGISKENQDKIKTLNFNNYSIEFLKIDTDKYFKNFQVQGHLNISTYNRFLIPILKPDIKKLIYLDSDTIVLGNIKELYDIDLYDNYIAAVAEVFEDNSNSAERIKILNLKDKYFNAGVLLINNKKWIGNNIIQTLFDTECAYRDKLKWADQDVLNIVFKDKIKYIDKKFNLITQDKNVLKNTIIRHFTTNIKPWQIHPDLNSDIIQNISDFWYYAKMTPFYDEMLSKVKYKDKIALRVLKLLLEKEKKNA